MGARITQQFSWFPCRLAALTLGCFSIWSGDASEAQIVPDGTVGSRIEQVNATRDRIIGGTTRGSNLFHNFSATNPNAPPLLTIDVPVPIVDNYVFLDRISWENFNESGDLKSQVEKYQKTFGYYPESVRGDKIYRTRENRAWCKERGIRISGQKLGRPPKNVSKQDTKQVPLSQITT